MKHKRGVWFSLIDMGIRVKTLRTARSRVRVNRGGSGTGHQSLEDFADRLDLTLHSRKTGLIFSAATLSGDDTPDDCKPGLGGRA